jgi:glucosamine kinase
MKGNLLIADCGSSKCDWIWAPEGAESIRTQTTGFNPFVHSAEYIRSEIGNNNLLREIASQVNKLCFYGAGCSDAARSALVADALGGIFSGAIQVRHDLEGAVLATCGREAGIVCILGTGSNACWFDGNEIRQSTPSLGYVLGDEGGGVWFGKELIRAFMYRQLPEELDSELRAFPGFDPATLLEHIYKQPSPNRFMASLMPFLGRHRNHPWVAALLRQGFRLFLDIHVKPYPTGDLPLHFVGSVAVHFKDIIEDICRACAYTPGAFINEPVLSLLEYHRRQE